MTALGADPARAEAVRCHRAPASTRFTMNEAALYVWTGVHTATVAIAVGEQGRRRGRVVKERRCGLEMWCTRHRWTLRSQPLHRASRQTDADGNLAAPEPPRRRRVVLEAHIQSLLSTRPPPAPVGRLHVF